MNTITGYELSGSIIKKLMRKNRRTIRGVAAQYDLTQTRVRFVREHGVKGEVFVRDWLEICGVVV
jgi:hypothetical protein